MAHSAFDHVTPLPLFESLPLRLDQAPSRSSALSRLLLVLPAALAVSVPLAAMGMHAAAEPATFAVLAERPVATAQIATGLAIWFGLFVVPAKRALQRLWARRRVEIADGMVRVEDRSVLGGERWSVPLGTYLGVAHHIRASLSGLTHEIVLVHADPTRSVTLMAGDKVTQSMLDRAKSLLGLPEVPPRTLYQSQPSGRFERTGAGLLSAQA